MTYTVMMAPSARGDLQRANPRIVPAIIEFIYGDLAKSPHRVGKPLRQELEGTFSARRGPYRILYSVDDERVTVAAIRIDHWSTAYRPR